MSGLDALGAITKYEAGELDETETVELFQALINSGLVWQLQGSYGRMGAALIESGHCIRPANQKVN